MVHVLDEAMSRIMDADCATRHYAAWPDSALRREMEPVPSHDETPCPCNIQGISAHTRC